MKEEMDNYGRQALPTRTQSVRAPVSQVSRPASRKNQTRHSLNAMEKQAGDLYDFLSELEDKKSAGPQQLKKFLESSEVSEKRDGNPAQERNMVQRGPSVSERLIKFSSIKESKSPVVSPKSLPGASDRSPKPPVRRDSVKRLQIARAKHSVSPTNQPYRPLSPSSKPPRDTSSKIPSSKHADEEEASITNLTKLVEENLVLEKYAKRSSNSSSNNSSAVDLSMHSNPDVESDVCSMKMDDEDVETKSNLSEGQLEISKSVPEVQLSDDSSKSSEKMISNAECSKDEILVDSDASNVSFHAEIKPAIQSSGDDLSVGSREKAKNKVSEDSNNKKSVPSRRIRNRKPDLPPKPTSLSSSPVPSSSPIIARRANRVRETQSTVHASSATKINLENKEKVQDGLEPTNGNKNQDDDRKSAEIAEDCSGSERKRRLRHRRHKKEDGKVVDGPVMLLTAEDKPDSVRGLTT